MWLIVWVAKAFILVTIGADKSKARVVNLTILHFHTKSNRKNNNTCVENTIDVENSYFANRKQQSYPLFMHSAVGFNIASSPLSFHRDRIDKGLTRTWRWCLQPAITILKILRNQNACEMRIQWQWLSFRTLNISCLVRKKNCMPDKATFPLTTSSVNRCTSMHHDPCGTDRSTSIGLFDSSWMPAEYSDTASVRVMRKINENQK